MVNHDEYTDYSCSTSVERLARDVEVLLRSWHVAGSDRHISFSHSTSSPRKSPVLNRSGSVPNFANVALPQTQQQQQHPVDGHGNGYARRSSTNDATTSMPRVESFNVQWESTLDSPHKRKQPTCSPRESASIPTTAPDSTNVRLIRSATVNLSVSFVKGSGRTKTIPLTLSLWDGPASTTNAAALTFGDTQTNNSTNQSNIHLPQSLRRTQFRHMPSDPFSNFSTLFGIGQHITLTPTTQTTTPNTNSPNTPLPSIDLVAILLKSVLNRHELSTTSPWVVASALSSVLQTALNCAVSSCQCRIPVFGLWGLYHPPQQPLDDPGGGDAATHSATNTNAPSIQSMAKNNNAFGGGDHELFPSWLPVHAALPSDSFQKASFSYMPGTKKRKDKKLHEAVLNRNFLPTSLSGTLLASGMVSSEESPPIGAQCLVSVLPGNEQNIFRSSNTNDNDNDNNNEDNNNCNNWLFVWGRILMEHCPPGTPHVELWGAQHVYTWLKPKEQRNTSLLFGNSKNELRMCAWRNDRWLSMEEADWDDEGEDAYKRKCQRHALSLLGDAAGATLREPWWGPSDDPLQSVHITVTWNGLPKPNNETLYDDDDNNHANKNDNTANNNDTDPLLILPLKIRSRRTMSRKDWSELEDATERAILDPLLSPSFLVQAHYDRNTSLTPLAASQRCVLAALIRTAVLHPDSLLSHVTNENILDEWSEEGRDGPVIDWLSNHARVGHVTRGLVDVMNWTTVADDMIEPFEAESIVRRVLDGSSGLGFPSPPESAFNGEDNNRNGDATNNPWPDADEGTFHPLLKSAPVGRLLSLLFVEMTRLRSASSMALVWLEFVKELRARWDCRESLPNMGHIPGLDPEQDIENAKTCFSTIGLKANFAAFVHSSEPDPNDLHCLIGQKLQVFNIGIECATALEILECERRERKQNQPPGGKQAIVEFGSNEGPNGHAPSVAPTEIIHNSAESVDAGEHTMSAIPERAQHGPMRAIEGPQEQSCASDDRTQQFYDALDDGSLTGSIDENPWGLTDVVPTRKEIATTVTQRHNRQGARCPVHGVNLIASGDQLYAPYLQRPFPPTDDIILERRMLLASRRVLGSSTLPKDKKQKVQSRLEVAHRLQKAKLLSDMCAFKAANPGAVFQDFTNWYGNPGNPLDDYKADAETKCRPKEAVSKSAATKLDNASEAIQILISTRDFWSDTWDEATSVPAVEQSPLFDVFKAVEMVLNHLETMHPASLMNQIMAVNLSMSYFALLASAGDAIHIGVVYTTIQKLRMNIEVALRLLSRDVSNGACPTLSEDKGGHERLPKHASSEAIAACENVCNTLADAEALLSRAVSLLQKFPYQYEFVQTILRRADGDVLPLDNKEGRSGILNVIRQSQKLSQSSTDTLPTPSLREYILRNQDDDIPCQLFVRFGDERAFDGVDTEGGLLLALTKSYPD